MNYSICGKSLCGDFILFQLELKTGVTQQNIRWIMLDVKSSNTTGSFEGLLEKHRNIFVLCCPITLRHVLLTLDRTLVFQTKNTVKKSVNFT